MKCVHSIALLGLLALAGCSIPPGVDGAMERFSTAADTADTALTAYDTALSKRLTVIHREVAVKHPNSVQAQDPDNAQDPGKDCTTGSAGCVIQFSAEPGVVEPIKVKTLIPLHLAAMHEITLYADSLEAITKADAVPAVKAAFDQASATAVSLAQLFPHPGLAPAVKAFSVPVSKAGVWIFGKYQDSIKLDALRDAIGQMEPVMKEAVAFFSTAAEFGSLPDRKRLVANFDSSVEAFETQQNDAALDRVLNSADELNAALAAKPSAVFLKLGEAHQQLLEALNKDDITLATALQKIEEVIGEAETLAAIAKEFEAATAIVGNGG